jgi:5-bromo-4-chloroindolyl phosphate hydrolysis protein
VFILIIHDGRWISKSTYTILKYILKSVINMGSKVYNKLPNYIKDVDSYTDFKKESGTPHNRDSNLSLTVTCVAVVSFPIFRSSTSPRFL